MNEATIKKFQTSLNKMREKVIDANGGQGVKGLTTPVRSKGKKSINTSKEREVNT